MVRKAEARDTYTASIPVFKNGRTVNVSLSGSYDMQYLSGLGTEVGNLARFVWH